MKKIHAHIIDTNVPQVQREEKRVFDGKIYQKFGSDNLFPQAIASLTRKSPIHRGVLNYKRVFIGGKGFNFDEGNQQLEAVIKRANTRESLSQVLKKIILDKSEFGNGFMEITTDSRKTFVNLFHQDATKIRLLKDGTGVVIHPDWANEHSYTPEQVKILPFYPNFIDDGGVMRSVIQFKNYEPEFTLYGIPEWVSALDAVAIGYKTNKWNVSRLDNSFQSSGVLLVDGDMSDEDAEELKEDFKNEFTGEGNQGKILMIIKQLGKTEGTQFVPIQQANEGDWMKLHKQSADDIIVAHNWFRSLSGIRDSEGFDTQRILNEYQIALSTVISEEQQNYLDVLIPLFDDFGIDATSLSFVNKPPVNIATAINLNKVITKGEARKAIGLQVDETDETMNQTIE